MRINAITINQYNNNAKKPMFKAVDHFLPVKQIPDLVCACCGKKVLNADKFSKITARIAKDLKFNLDNGALDYVKRIYPEAWDYLLILAEKYPKKTLEEILEKDNGTYKQLKQKVSLYFELPNKKSRSYEKISNDRKISSAFFEIIGHSRTFMKSSSEVMKKLMPLKSYLYGLRKEVFEQYEIYARKYPEKTLQEIINMPEISSFHEMKNIMQRASTREKSDYHFENIVNLVQKKNPKAVDYFRELKEKAMEIFENESDIQAREYYLKEIYLNALEEYNCLSLKNKVLNEINNIPLTYLTVDSYFSYAKYHNYTDGKILASLFQPVLTSEEHLYAISDGGSDKTSNKIVMHRSCNLMRANKPYTEVLKYRPDMAKHVTKQIQTVIDNLLKGKLPIFLDFYPINIVQNLKNISNGLINIDLTKYCEANLSKFEQERDIAEKMLSQYVEKRKSVITNTSKVDSNFYKIKDELAEINAKIKEYKNTFEVKSALVQKMKEYLNIG